MSIEIYYTGDLTTPNGSDIDGYYGEATEEGTGFDYENGWVDPSWSRREVYENREDVRPDTFDATDETPLIEWIVNTLAERLGAIDLTGNVGESTYYAAEADEDYITGVSIRLAAHIHGASDEILAAVSHSLNFERARNRSSY
jgi:hypothetical protein